MPFAKLVGACAQCGGDWLDPIYNYPTAGETFRAGLGQRPGNIWRYWELLPLLNRNNIVSMGEGGTPLLPLANLSLMVGCPNIFMKDERQTPTGSFKDRQASLAISVFKEAGIDEVVVASTGNVAISYSAYCARAGIKLWTFLSSTVPAEKMREVALYGTEVIKVSSTYDKTKEVAAQFARQKGFFYDKGVRNIAAKESMKTLAFEIAEQLGQMNGGGFQAPDWYIQAVSGGLGPVGVWRGFEELQAMGLTDKMPKLALIQAEGCAPMVNSFKAGLDEAESVTAPQTLIATVATGSPGAVYPYLRDIILQFGGTMETVSDEDAFRAMHVMAQMDGLSMEPAAAIACAGLFKLIGQQIIRPDETVVVNVSGHTFPVDKFTLDDRRVRDFELVEDGLAPSVPPSEGLISALDRLDDRVQSIAVLEDEPDAARLLRRILQAKGQYKIHEASNGRDGIELIRQRRPDLVILDLMMPEIDGFTVLDMMKADEMLHDVPVIVVTAKELSRAERRRLSGQVESLLQKGSFMEEELLDNILEALE
ncbi:MAG: pyridoxal-phosphate dependent enzyme [Anaerolineae bacterium]